MVVVLIVVCEIAFWVLLAAGLALRYLAKRPRLGAAVLVVEPLLEVVLLVATAVDLRRGTEPSWQHGLAALYIGFTVAWGPYLIRRLDARVAHRFAGGPAPVPPPRYGSARARYEGGLWLRTLTGAAIACALLQAAIWYVGDDGATGPLRSWQVIAVRSVLIHGIVALSYTLWPKKAPREASGRGDRAGAEGGGSGTDAVGRLIARAVERSRRAPEPAAGRRPEDGRDTSAGDGAGHPPGTGPADDTPRAGAPPRGR